MTDFYNYCELGEQIARKWGYNGDSIKEVIHSRDIKQEILCVLAYISSQLQGLNKVGDILHTAVQVKHWEDFKLWLEKKEKKRGKLPANLRRNIKDRIQLRLRRQVDEKYFMTYREYTGRNWETEIRIVLWNCKPQTKEKYRKWAKK